MRFEENKKAASNEAAFLLFPLAGAAWTLSIARIHRASPAYGNLINLACAASEH
jgi:hypothetical protein